MASGGCHCGAIRYTVEGTAEHVVLCHCEDCRRSAGAPVVGWSAHKAEQVSVTGQPSTYHSSAHGRREFCPTCGTGLFYRNEQALPGLIDIQLATLDQPDASPPAAQIQVADRLTWMASAHELPTFDRYPGM